MQGSGVRVQGSVPAADAAPLQGTIARAADALAWFVLLVVVGLRPLITETYDTALVGISARLTDLSPATPLRTALIDVAIVLAGLLVCVARVIQPAPRQRTGIELGAACVLVAAIVSCVFAGQKRLAINGAVDWLCLPVLTITLVQLLSSNARVRLLLCVVLAGAAVQAAVCLNQVLYEFPETRDDYLARKSQLWGPEADPAHVEMFERRLNAREAYGYLEHANVAGGYLLLTGLVGVGVAAACRRAANQLRGQTPDNITADRMQALLASLLAAGLLLVIPTTGSIGAMASMGAAALLLTLVRLFGHWIDTRRRASFGIGMGLAIVGVIVVVAYGSVRGTLPHPSLAFRWQYWTAAARMVADHPLTGVGRENFGRHYVHYKPIESPEEVANPHNFLVQAAAEWGIVGLIGVMAMLAGGAWAATRCKDHAMEGGWTPNAASAPREQPAKRGSSHDARPYAWMLALGLSIFGIRAVLLGSDDPAFITWETGFAGLIWLIAFGLLAVATSATMKFGWSGLNTLVCVALAAFLLQDTINFALFVPGAATTFFALLAVPVAARAPVSAGKASPWKGLALGLAGGLVVIAMLLWPVAPTTAGLERARAARQQLRAGQPLVQPAYKLYSAAISSDRFDPTAAAELADWLLVASGVAPAGDEWLREAKLAATTAIQRDPHSTQAWRRRGDIVRAMAEAGRPELWPAAIGDYEQALGLYPESPHALVDLAEVEAAAGEAMSDTASLDRALTHYHAALELDARRPAWEKIRRLREPERAKILTAIERLTAP